LQLNLSGKTAIVTGGSAGIGLACAQALYAEGVSVLIAARDVDRLAQGLEAITDHAPESNAKALSVSADVSTAGGVERAVERALSTWGQVDILINNAGSAPSGDFYSLSDDAYQGAWELKLLGYIRMVRALAPQMKARREGRIVNIVGAAAHNPTPSFVAGGTANAAIINFTKGISQDLAPYGVRINAISPGPVNTERARQLARQEAEAQGISVEEAKARRIASVPLSRMAEADEIADMALFLVSDRAASITGAEVLIDGGATASV